MNDTTPYGEPESLKFTSAYLRRLLIESPYVYAKLTNPGGSVIQMGTTVATDSLNDYSSEIGNGYHLDLIEAAIALRDNFSQSERDALMSWAEGLDSNTAASLTQEKGYILRKRRQRAVEKLVKELDDGRTDTA